LLLSAGGLCLVGPYCLAEYHLRQARQALVRQRYERALGELHEALRFRANSARLHLLAARVARQRGKFPVAWEHLRQCRDLQQRVSAELQLEEYLLRAQNGELEEVYPYLAPHLVQDDEQAPLVLEALAHIYLFTYRFDLAWQCLQHWLQRQPENVEALFLRGTYYSLKLDFEATVADLRHVLELDPEHIPARLLLAQSLKESNHPLEAANEYAAVLGQDPENFTARLGMASHHLDLEQWSEGRALLEDLSREQPLNTEVMILRARAEAGEGRVGEAGRLLKEVLAINPGSHSACYQLVLYLHQVGDDRSVPHYEAMLNRIEKDQQRLLKITGQESELLSSSPALACELGEVCLRLGITQRGLHWLHTALRLDPQYRRAHEQLLHYYEGQGTEGETQAAFHRRWLERSPQ
jgi:tetratricopeptide (TPR) repeat protein